MGGFAKILERISNTQRKISVNSSLYYLKTIDNVCARVFLLRLQKELFHCVLKFSFSDREIIEGFLYYGIHC